MRVLKHAQEGEQGAWPGGWAGGVARWVNNRHRWTREEHRNLNFPERFLCLYSYVSVVSSCTELSWSDQHFSGLRITRHVEHVRLVAAHTSAPVSLSASRLLFISPAVWLLSHLCSTGPRLTWQSERIALIRGLIHLAATGYEEPERDESQGPCQGTCSL